jgi:hypothetical protein
VPRRSGKGTVTADQRRVDLGECHVHRIGRSEIVPQFPRAIEQVHVGMTAEVELGEVGERLLGPIGDHLARPHEAPEGLSDLHAEQVWGMELIAVAKQPCLDP